MPKLVYIQEDWPMQSYTITSKQNHCKVNQKQFIYFLSLVIF